MKFRLTCTSCGEKDMIEYVYKIQMQDITVVSEWDYNTYKNPVLRYMVYLDSIEDLVKMQKALGCELILGPFDHPDRIEIYDDYRE